ncbi:hypothetical protein LAZ67_8000967 [Cordylochernes scorpioides]|uniref:Uncharacterized protein n=1 Tax=Cordylochernes scorpioides TaxID=51811 RepID=A0ABY6KTF8_9ARAC|nr:hypothetical protein LAZ67_8000967 [Cordylochernes scorpioides]
MWKRGFISDVQLGKDEQVRVMKVTTKKGGKEVIYECPVSKDLENVPTEQEKDDNELSITKIQNLYAFDLFNKKQFQKALHIFFKMNTGQLKAWISQPFS